MLDALRSERGQALLEYAVIFPLLMLLLIGIMEFGVAIMVYDSISNAAREGARYGVIRQHHDDLPGIAAVTRRSMMGLDEGALTITITPPSPVADVIQVEVDYDHSFITPLIGLVVGSPTVHLHTMASMRIE